MIISIIVPSLQREIVKKIWVDVEIFCQLRTPSSEYQATFYDHTSCFHAYDADQNPEIDENVFCLFFFLIFSAEEALRESFKWYCRKNFV